MSDPVDNPPPGRWLNPAVLGMGLTSFLADASYETVSAVLPGFLGALRLPAPSLVLGLVDGIADAVSSFVKLGAGWWSDRLGHRKAIVVAGYALSGSAMGLLFAVAVGWPLILTGRVLAWLGRGIRKPLREAILAEAIAPEDRGKAFGFHRAGDTLGAILGPLLGAGILAMFAPEAAADPTASYRLIFWLTLIPGIGSALAFALLIRERRKAANPKIKLWTSIQALPNGFRRYLVGVGVFGAGDFAHTLLILAATAALTEPYGARQAAAMGAILYAVRNIFAAAAAYPVGHLSDHLGRRGLLIGGYALGGLVMAGFAAVFAADLATLPILAVLFALAGVYVAVEDSLEGAMTADLIPDLAMRGTAYGVIATVNGLGDLVSSAAVGGLWATTAGYPAGFLFSAMLMLAGAAALARVR